MASPEDTWQRIEHWLSVNAPEILSSLNEPASRQSLQELSDAVGQPLPDAMTAVYLVHNGQDEESEAGGLLPHGDSYGDMAHTLADIERVLSDHAMMSELLDGGEFADIQKEPNPAIHTAAWNKRWVPIANDGGGDYHCVDLDPGPEGVVGQIITVGESDTQTVVAKSLSAWLAQIADEMESGAVHVDETYGLVRWS